MPQHVYQFTVGRIPLSVIHEGQGSWAATHAFSVPEEAWRQSVQADARGHVTLDINIVHLSVPGHSILIDSGLGEAHPTRAHFCERFGWREAGSLVSCLAELGVKPEQITEVVLSHAHGDHMMGTTVERNGRRVAAFPNAKVLVMRADWEAKPGRERPGAAFDFHLPPLHEAGKLHLLDGPHEVALGVRIVPSPGETPGHVNVRVESDGQVFYYLGDLFHHPAEVGHETWSPPGRDTERLVASRRALVAEALREDALLMTAHMPFPGLGRLRRRDGETLWIPAARP